ncbi:MAG: hypothetical protein HC827_19295 [Cyanobacteria bacterium RM1_2_2]|nr:hypothetical protein [Cyanobacteria bacterium RM1_2_2]
MNLSQSMGFGWLSTLFEHKHAESGQVLKDLRQGDDLITKPACTGIFC